MKTSTHPVLVFGFDAGDPELLLKWSLDGSMPTLASILQRGCHARFTGPEMVSEHGMWVSLTSGISRSQHGYYYFRQLVPRSYELLPTSGRSIQAQPFWSNLPHRRIFILDVPDIAAPAPAQGFQISEWATHYPYFPASTQPPELLSEIVGEFGPRSFINERPGADEATDRKIFAALMKRIESKKNLCLRYLTQGRFDLAFVVFGECHTGAHQFWKYHASGSGDLAHALRDIYRAIDGVLGAILEKWPADAPVFVVSSVGINEKWPAASLNEAFCRQLGYQFSPASGPTSRQRPIDLIRRLIPQTLRNQLSRLVPREKRDLLLSDKFRSSTDWTRTTLFNIPAYYTGQFRVNLRGREPSGIVQPGQEYSELLDRVERDLLSLVDPVTDRPAIKAVWKTVEMFGGSPPESLPDILAEWHEASHFMEEVRHPKCVLRQAPCEFHRSTDHSHYGFFAAAGHGVSARSNLGDFSPLDLAPTVLSHLSEVENLKLDGKPIAGIAIA